jgi:hypothetical protein
VLPSARKELEETFEDDEEFEDDDDDYLNMNEDEGMPAAWLGVTNSDDIPQVMSGMKSLLTWKYSPRR